MHRFGVAQRSGGVTRQDTEGAQPDPGAQQPATGQRDAGVWFGRGHVCIEATQPTAIKQRPCNGHAKPTVGRLHLTWVEKGGRPTVGSTRWARLPLRNRNA